LEFVNAIESDATATGARLALNHGVSDAIAMLAPELTALDRTVSASGAMLQAMSQLGKSLNPFNTNVAPIAAPLRARPPHEEYLEPVRSDLPEQTLSPAALRANMRHVPGLQEESDRTTPQLPPNTPRLDKSMPPSRPLLGQRVLMVPPDAPTSTKAATRSTSGIVTAPTTLTPPELSSSRSGTVAEPSIAPRMPQMVRMLRPDAGPSPAVVAPMPMSDAVRTQQDVRTEQIVIGAMAPVGPSQATTDIPAPFVDAELPVSHMANGVSVPQAATRRDRSRVTMTVPSGTTTDASTQPDGSQSASAELSRPESEPRQGVLVLDSAQLGRWMIDHLERHASRPGSMTTGIDPRISATYPGAPTGA
jgi:hypothetical protein